MSLTIVSILPTLQIVANNALHDKRDTSEGKIEMHFTERHLIVTVLSGKALLNDLRSWHNSEAISLSIFGTLNVTLFCFTNHQNETVFSHKTSNKI